jgi:hypothetical protein
MLYGPFSLGARFEIYEQFISSVFNFFFKPWKTADTDSAHSGTHLYFLVCANFQHQHVLTPPSAVTIGYWHLSVLENTSEL